MHEIHAEMELFHSALAADDDSRAEVLRSIADPVLRGRVEALLVAHDQIGDDDPPPVLIQRPSPLDDVANDPLIGAEFDGYRILGVLGRGGMGVVYEAEQATPRRRVAIKTLQVAATLLGSLRRLEREAEALARLQHQNIARLFAVGHAAALAGRAYLVMERIDGVPIDRFVRERRLDVRERVELLASLAMAVGHAHARGIIHRDLKPANVLVEPNGSVKVLDFGIARILDDAGEDAATLLTRDGQVLGTIAYLSPESVALEGPRPDARADVYALGAIAYELLTGNPPIEVTNVSLTVAFRRIAEVEPVALGLRSRRLRGDLETVVHKALAKHPADRYRDAADFGWDLRRFLIDEPILARPSSLGYRARKFLHRHRYLTAAVVATVLSLWAGLSWALYERGLAQQAAKVAEATARRESMRAVATDRVLAVLRSTLMQATPQSHDGTPPDINTITDALARQVDTAFPDDPYTLGRTHLLLASVMEQRDETERAAHHGTRAEEELGRSELTGSRERAQIAYRQGQMARRRGDFDVARLRFQAALCGLESADGVDDERARCLLALGNLNATLRHDLAESLLLCDRVLEIADSLRDASIRLSGLQLRARVLDSLDRHAEALTAYGELVSQHRELRPASDSLAICLQNQGHLLQRLGRHSAAIPLLEEALTIRRKVYGDQPHRALAYALDNLGVSLREVGQPKQALMMFDEAAGILRAVSGVRRIEALAVCLTERGVAHRNLDQLDAARSDFEEAITIFDEIGAEPTTMHVAALEHLAMLEVQAGNGAKSLPLAQRAVAVRETIHGEEHYLVARALEVLALAKQAEGATADLEAIGKRIFVLRRAHYGEEHWMTWLALPMVIDPMVARGELKEAIDLLEKGHRALAKQLGTEDRRTRSIAARLEEVRAKSGG